MHEYILRRLMTLFAVALQAIYVWNISKVQINVQIYAFNFDMHCKSAFCFLKIIMHLYYLIAQMQSLCWDCINVCNTFSVLFSLLISLIFVILRYCNAIACWNHYEEENASSASQLYLRIFLNENIQKYYFLDDECWEMTWITFIKWTCISLHACLISCVWSLTQLCNVILFYVTSVSRLNKASQCL